MKSGNLCDVIYKEVVIIGNGPSGIALSYLLSGNLPFLTSSSHPDEMFSMRLQSKEGKCLVGEDLRHLADGLEGRTTNPVSLLLDSLLHPCADIGIEMDPLIEFRKVGAEIDHVVLGNGPPGGSWHKMDPHILTLSLGRWMSLPGLPFVSRDSGEKRAYACNVAKYYTQYVNEMELSKYFNNNVWVTDVQFQDAQLEKKNKYIILDTLRFFMRKSRRRTKRPRESLCQGQSPDRKLREGDGKTVKNCDSSIFCDIKMDEGRWLVECRNFETGEIVNYKCRYLVLANGTNDLPNKLDLGEEPSWLCYDLRSLEDKLDKCITESNIETVEPVMIVGAGLSAADAVIAARGRNVPVVHVFRNKSALNKQLPENMYPEYHKVHQMMIDGGSSYPYYTAYPEYNIIEIDNANRSVTLCSKGGKNVKIRVSYLAIFIGSRPDLTFLPGVFEEKSGCNPITLNIDRLTNRVEDLENLFAIGQLAGDNFVRFILGGAFAVVSELYKRKGLIVE